MAEKIYIYKNERWTREDGTPPTYDELMEICVSHMRDESARREWRYSHCEIEASCGGEVALEVRANVIRRREIIRKQKAPNDGAMPRAVNNPKI